MLASPDLRKNKPEFSPFFEPGQSVWLQKEGDWEKWQVVGVEEGMVGLKRRVEGRVDNEIIRADRLSDLQAQKEEEDLDNIL